jgi:ribokinase
LTVVGDYAWDVLIRTNAELLTGGDTYGEVALSPGGSAANAAVWARRCGTPTRFVGKVGRDRLGDLAEDDLAAERVDAYLIRSDAHATGSVAVWVDPTGQRSMVSGKGADHHLLSSELSRDLFTSAGHVHLSGWSFFSNPPRSAARTAATWAKEAGATTSFDPASFQLIDQMGVSRFVRFTADLGFDLLFPNVDEGRVLTGETEPAAIVEALVALYPGTGVVLKLDAKGALVRDEQGNVVPIAPARGHLVDATGAGDAFAGAFLAHWTRGAGVVASATFAAEVAAWVIQRQGARPPLDARFAERLRTVATDPPGTVDG